MKYFTSEEYAKQNDLPSATAWRLIRKGLKTGDFVLGPKVKIRGRLYDSYFIPDTVHEFAVPATTFWNDPFNKTGWQQWN